MGFISVMNVLLAFIKNVAAIIAIVFVAFVAYPSLVDAGEINDMEKNSFDTATIILSSPLVYEEGVFNSSRLDSAGGGPEVYAWPCEYAYSAEVSDIRSGRSWSFGYAPQLMKNEDKIERYYSVSVLDEGEARFYHSSSPANLRFSLRKDFLTRLSCAVRMASESGMTRNITLNDCPLKSGSTVVEGGSSRCTFTVSSQSVEQAAGSLPWRLCIQSSEGIDCRSSSVEVRQATVSWTSNMKYAIVSPASSCGAESEAAARSDSVIFCAG